jgi:transposase-like protein
MENDINRYFMGLKKKNKMKTKKVKCIACKGKGHVNRIVRVKISDEQKKEIYKLYRKGYGFREIARKLKIKHPYSVQYAILTANKIY